MTEFRVLVTGAAGYIGSRVVAELHNTHPDWIVTAVDNYYNGDVERIGDTTVRDVDIRNRRSLDDDIAEADVVLHLAAISGVDDCAEHPDLAYEVNVTGTANVAWGCRKAGAGLVFPYSMAVLGDPTEFPITASNHRNPLNWYGTTKLLGEEIVSTMAEDAFPAHLLLKSNLYGEHSIDGQRVSKGTVINFFVERAIAGEPLTVYEPGTQARNYVHVVDVATAYVRSVERLKKQLERDETGAEQYEIASTEAPDITTVAEIVQRIAEEELDQRVPIEVTENPREAETLVDRFEVDISTARDRLGWAPERTIEDDVRGLLRDRPVT